MSYAHVKVSLGVEELSLKKGIENDPLKRVMRLEIVLPHQEEVQRVIMMVSQIF